MTVRSVPHQGSVREPAVAGRFYPADAQRLAATVNALLAACSAPATDAADPVAVIVPHAGYAYSGPVAASGYARLGSVRARVRRVIVLGPAHFVPVTTAAVSTVAAFRTPLGLIPVDVDRCARLVRHELAVASDRPHLPEHSLEVQLPFLQRTLDPGWTLIPVLVGAGGDQSVADLLPLVTDETTLVVCSSDLSHYLPQEQARVRDRRTANAVVARDAAAIGPRDACGAAAIRGLLRWVAGADLHIELLDLRTSADTSGSPSRVVGYGAFTVTR